MVIYYYRCMGTAIALASVTGGAILSYQFNFLVSTVDISVLRLCVVVVMMVVLFVLGFCVLFVVNVCGGLFVFVFFVVVICGFLWCFCK